MRRIALACAALLGGCGEPQQARLTLAAYDVANRDALAPPRLHIDVGSDPAALEAPYRDTDESFIIRFDADTRYTVSVSASGYQPATFDVLTASDRRAEWLHQARVIWLTAKPP